MSNSLSTVDTDTLLDMAFPESKSIDLYSDVPTDELLTSLADKEEADSVDTETGAPFSVRAQVNAAQREDDRLATLKKFYPDALPVGIRFDKGAEKFGAGNFVYTDPETGQLTLFDEDKRMFGMPVPSFADLTADVGPEIAETVGGLTAGTYAATVAGAATSPSGVGIIPAATTAYIVGEGLGSATARDLYTAAFTALGETEDTRTGPERFIDFSTTALLNGFGGAVASKIMDGVNYYVGNPIRYATGTLSKTARETFDRMIRSGVTAPTLGQVTQNPLVNMMETFFRNMPMSAKVMHENASQTLADISKRMQELSSMVGGAKTPEEAGRKLMTSMQAARKTYEEQRDNLYGAVGNLIDKKFSGSAPATQEFVNELVLLKNNPLTAGPVDDALIQAQKVLSAVDNGQLTYDALKSFRTDIGRIVRQAETKNYGALSPSETKLKALYGKLSSDLDSLVEQAAVRQMDLFDDPAAAKEAGKAITEAYKKANSFVLQNEKKNLGAIDFIDKVLKKGEFDSVDALKEVMRNANMSGERIRKLKEKLAPEEFDELSGYVLGNLGMPRSAVAEGMELGESIAKEGAEYVAERGFSPQTFMTNWNNLSKESKELLFGGTQHKELVPALDDLMFTINRVKSAADQMANPSGTAKAANAIAFFTSTPALMYGGGDTGFAYGLMALGVPAGGSRLFTSPDVVKWLSTAVEKSAFDPQSMGQHVRRLGQIALVNPEIRSEIEGMLERLQAESPEPIVDKSSASVREQQMVPENNETNFREVSTREVSDKLLPTSEELMGQMDQVTVPQVEGPLFEETITETPDVNLAMSPTVLPRDDDRELALRLRGNAGGIGALV